MVYGFEIECPLYVMRYGLYNTMRSESPLIIPISDIINQLSKMKTCLFKSSSQSPFILFNMTYKTLL